MSSRNVDIAVLAEILEEVLRDDSSALDLVSALPLPCRERIVAAHATLVFQTRSRPLPPHLVAAYLRDLGGAEAAAVTQQLAAANSSSSSSTSATAKAASAMAPSSFPAKAPPPPLPTSPTPASAATIPTTAPDPVPSVAGDAPSVVEPEPEGPADLPPVGQPVSYGPPSSSAGGRPFIPAAMDDDSEEVVAPTVAMVAQISDSDDEPPAVVLSGDLPSTQITNVAPDAVEPVVVAAEPIPDASNDTITMAPSSGMSTAVDQTPAKAKPSPYKSPPLPPPPAPAAFPNAAEAALAADFGFTSAAEWLQHRRVELGQEGFAAVPRTARAGDACPPATTPARLEEIQRQIDAELASDPSMAPRPKKAPPQLPSKSAPSAFPAAKAPPPPLPPQDAELDRLHVAALQETRDNARAAARLEAAVAANGEEYVAYKARVERRGARAEHLPAPSSDLARLLVSTYGDLVRREEATADGAVMPRAAEAPYWVLTALPTGVWARALHRRLVRSPVLQSGVSSRR